jgi:AcrR family transcriptional regulator
MNHSSQAEPPATHTGTGSRSQQKRALILETAMRHFAERGYEPTRVSDIALELGIAKGSIFQHFLSKDGLFFEAYKNALKAFPAYLDAPETARSEGFFAVVRYRLAKAEQFKRNNQTAYRIVLLGNYGSDLKLKKRINQYLREEDPLGTLALVRLGLERQEIRADIDEDLIVSFLDWTLERFQDALLMEEFDPGLFHRSGENARRNTEQRIEEFLKVLWSAIGSDAERKVA